MTDFSVAEMRQANLALAKGVGEMDLRASLEDILRIGHETIPGRFGSLPIL